MIPRGAELHNKNNNNTKRKRISVFDFLCGLWLRGERLWTTMSSGPDDVRQ